MNILFVSEFYFPHIGGVELVIQRIAEEVARRGHRATVVTTRLPGTPGFEEMNGVSIYRVHCPRFGRRYFFTFLSPLRLRTLVGSADVVHTTTYTGAPAALMCAKLFKKPCLITVQGVSGNLWRLIVGKGPIAWIPRIGEHFILTLPFDVCVCVSEATRFELAKLGVDLGKTCVIYNGIDHDLFSPRLGTRSEIRSRMGVDNTQFLYLYYGRPNVVKGLRYLLEAVETISERIPGSKAVIITSKDSHASLRSVRREIEKLKIGDRVMMLDAIERTMLPHYIAAADCVVVPSLTEGFGLTAAESCSVGVPVVATTAGSLPEVVSGRFVLVKPGSAFAIAEGVEMVSKNQCRSSPPKEFRWNRAVDEYIRVYGDLITAHRQGRRVNLQGHPRADS